MVENFSFNPNAKKVWKKVQIPSANQLTQEILQGNHFALGRAITLLESTKSNQLKIGKNVLKNLHPHSGKSIRIGITGVPGVGKSTFIEALGMYLIQQLNKKVAVLSIDPSSSITKGSILGDKTRMNNLSSQKNAFIRPSSSKEILGGVSAKTRENILLCEACGFDVILVETVGVGQSEHEVFNLVDFFLLLMVANTGDELQGIKRGIIEMAHAILINKADGDQIKEVELTRAIFGNLLSGIQSTGIDWKTRVGVCSAVENKGIDNFWNVVDEYCTYLGFDQIQKIRKNQTIKHFEVLFKDLIFKKLMKDSSNKNLYQKIVIGLQNGTMTMDCAVQTFIENIVVFQ